MKRHRLTWRKVKQERYRIPEQYQLSCDGKSIGRAVDHPRGLYFYVRDDDLGIPWHNTASAAPFATMDEVKAACVEYVRACLAENKKPATSS